MNGVKVPIPDDDDDEDDDDDDDDDDLLFGDDFVFGQVLGNKY